MATLVEVKVPDIGDFKDVRVIEVLIKPGDAIQTEAGLVTLESDKATMEVPSPVDGVVKEIKVKVGDKVSEGFLLLTVDADAAPAGVAPAQKIKEGGHSTAPGAPAADYGTAGVYEAIDVRVPDIGDFKDVPIIEVHVKPGDTVKAEDSLITLESDKATMDVPSPAAGKVAEVKVNVGDKVAEGTLILTLSTDAADAAPAPKVSTPSAAPVAAPIAASYAGSADIECEMLVLGAGPGGYSAAFRSADLGMKTVLVERYTTLGGVCLNVGCIPSKALLHTASVVDEVKDMGAHGITFGAPQIDIDKLRGFKEGVVKKLTGGLAGMAKTRKVETVRGIGRFLDPYHVEVELTSGTGQDKTGAKKTVRFQKAIIANGNQIGADKAGVAVTDRGFIPVDKQMRTNVSHIFAIGDIVGQPMLAHKAVHEAHVAAEVAVGQKSYFDARQIPSVAYTDPEVAWAGLTEEQCKAQGIKYGKAVFPWAASGRAIANGRDEGFTKLLFDEATHRCVGGGIVGTHAGDLIGEVCLAVEMGCDPTDIGKTIHPHPTLCESIGMVAELFEGVCTDLPPAKKK